MQAEALWKAMWSEPSRVPARPRCCRYGFSVFEEQGQLFVAWAPVPDAPPPSQPVPEVDSGTASAGGV